MIAAQAETGVTAVAHVIQLSVAPVFLLSGIGAMLAVMTNRLARIVDRARTLEQQLAAGPAAHPQAGVELMALSRRSRLISYAITLCTITALLITAVIAVLFFGAFLAFDTSTLVAWLFIGGMGALFLGLLSFLREIFLATSTMRIGRPHP